jgi:hypothetical protein
MTMVGARDSIQILVKKEQPSVIILNKNPIGGIIRVGGTGLEPATSSV